MVIRILALLVKNLLGFFFLYFNRKKLKVQDKHGHVLYWYFIWYGLGRLLIEGLRTDSLMLGEVGWSLLGNVAYLAVLGVVGVVGASRRIATLLLT